MYNAYRDFSTYIGALARTWRVRPKVLLCTVVNPFSYLCCHSVVSWGKFKISISELDKLQRPAFLGITGARKKTSTSAIEVHCTCSWRLKPEYESTGSN
jgi:hypothetical protein